MLDARAVSSAIRHAAIGALRCLAAALLVLPGRIVGSYRIPAAPHPERPPWP